MKYFIYYRADTTDPWVIVGESASYREAIDFAELYKKRHSKQPLDFSQVNVMEYYEPADVTRELALANNPVLTENVKEHITVEVKNRYGTKINYSSNAWKHTYFICDGKRMEAYWLNFSYCSTEVAGHIFYRNRDVHDDKWSVVRPRHGLHLISDTDFLSDNFHDMLISECNIPSKDIVEFVANFPA